MFCEQPQMVGTVCSGGRGGLTCTEGVLKTGKAARPGAGRARGTGTNVGAGWQGQWGLRKRKQMDNTPRPHCLLHTSWKAPHPESHQDVAQGTPGPYRHNSPFKSQGSGTPSLCCLHPCTCGENTVHSQENKTDSGFFWKANPENRWSANPSACRALGRALGVTPGPQQEDLSHESGPHSLPDTQGVNTGPAASPVCSLATRATSLQPDPASYWAC